MATSQPGAVGMAHTTVVPTNFEPDVRDAVPARAERDDRRERDEQSGRADAASREQ